MITLPGIISDYARGSNGGGYVYALDIEPSAADSWTTKRYATSAVTIDGDEYDEAIVNDLSRIVQKARVIQYGGIGTMPDLTVRLINRSRLHEEFVADRIANRRARLRLVAISSNRCLNSSFESATGTDPHHWTMHPGGGMSLCGRSNAQKYDGDYSCLIYGDTSESWVECDTIARGMRRGERLHVSGYFGYPTLTGTVGIALKLRFGGSGGTWRYYDATAGTFGAARVVNTVGTATAAWQRFGLDCDWAAWHAANPTDTSEYADVVVEIWSATGGGFYADAVQIEAWPNAAPTAYHHNRHELVAADCLTVFTGSVKRPKWQHRQIEFQLEAYNANQHRDIPVTTLTENMNSWSVPRNNIGKPFPMTYGDFYGDWIWSQQTVHKIARGIMTDLKTKKGWGGYGIKIYFDRPSMGLYHPTGTRKLYHYHDESNAYYEQINLDYATYSYDAVEFEDDLAANARFVQSSNPKWVNMGIFPIMCFLRARSLDSSTVTINNTSRVLDGDFSTFAYTDDITPNYSTKAYATFILEPCPFTKDNMMFGSPYTTQSAIFFAGELFFDASGGTSPKCAMNIVEIGGTGVVNIWLPGVAPYTLWANIGSSPNKLFTQEQITWNNCITEMKGIKLEWWYDGSPTDVIIRFVEIGAIVYISTIKLEDACPSAQLHGRKYGDSWGGRKGFGTGLVEHPAELVEGILRHELGVVTADIATAKYDAVFTARSGHKAAGQLHQIENSQDVINKICQEFAQLYYIDEYGRHALAPLDYSSTAVTTLTMRDFHDPLATMRLSLTPRESVVNDIAVRYNKDQWTGDYTRVSFVNKGDSSSGIPASYETKCDDSYDEIGERVQPLEVDCDWIKLDTQADWLCKWLVDWCGKQRHIVEAQMFVDGMRLELGDIVALDIDPLLPESVTKTSRFIVTHKSLDRKRGCVDITFLEVREP